MAPVLFVGDETFDTILVDPPFNLSKQYGKKFSSCFQSQALLGKGFAFCGLHG